MAAQPQTPQGYLDPSRRQQFELVPLRQLRGADMKPLLGREVVAWRTLHWDFSPAAHLMERYIDMQSLKGFALSDGGALKGYCYYVEEDRKALIGDLYVDRDIDAGWQSALLDMVLSDAARGGAHRVEAQPMMLRHPVDFAQQKHVVPRLSATTVYPRQLMLAPLTSVGWQPAVASAEMIPWACVDPHEAADLITECYGGHVDSLINDQYRSSWGSRRFLQNLTSYPGCGRLHPHASFGAIHPGGQLCGLLVASIVATGVGHVTQICVAPWAKSAGVGAALLHRSLTCLHQEGCTRTSLTVTVANRRAIALYERFGFTAAHRFNAYVWEWR